MSPVTAEPTAKESGNGGMASARRAVAAARAVAAMKGSGAAHFQGGRTGSAAPSRLRPRCVPDQRSQWGAVMASRAAR